MGLCKISSVNPIARLFMSEKLNFLVIRTGGTKLVSNAIRKAGVLGVTQN